MTINFDIILKNLSSILIEKKLKISLCESCTGGLISKIFTDYSGSSLWFLGSIIAYNNNVKTRLGVNSELIEKYGAVSKVVAKEMSESTLRFTGSDICLSVTGIAGPKGGSIDKPVGTVFYSFSTKAGFSYQEKFIFDGSRNQIRTLAAEKGIQIILDCMSKIKTQ